MSGAASRRASAVNYISRLPRSADLVIVGGGVVGAATAFFAAQSGLNALLLERRSALCTLTTPASTGAFRLQFDNLEELELVRESVHLFLNFAEVTAQSTYDLDIRQQGYLWLTTDEARAEEQRALVALQHGWGQDDVELLAGAEVRRRWPYVGDTVLQGRFRAGDGFLDPKALTLGLAASSGAPVAVSCAVTGFDVRDGRMVAVRTNAGAISAGAAVIAAGPFSAVVARGAGIDLPLRTVRRHKVVVPDLPDVPSTAPMTVDDDTGAHWRPALRGAYLLFTDPSTSPSPPSEDVAPDHRFALSLLDPSSTVSVARVAPFWGDVWKRGALHWIVQSGQYTMTPDHRPLLGETVVEGLWVNSGYSGHGIMGAPAGSRHLIDVLTSKALPVDNPFRPDRSFVQRRLDVL